MGHIKYQRRISLLRKENRALKFKLTILQKRFQKLAALCDIIGIDISDCYTKKDIVLKNSKENKKQLPVQAISPILNDIDDNLSVSPNNREYTFETKLFAYTIYTISAQAYRVLRNVIPLPSDSLLRRNFSEIINMLENQFSNISYAEDILNTRGLNINDDFIRCNLSVDAFAVNNIYNTNNYAFIYLILPFSNEIRPFPIFIENTKSGNATNSTFQNIENILTQSRKTKFKIELISVDGDRYYDSHFLTSFSLLTFIDLNDFSKITLDSICYFFDLNPEPFFSSDFLHLLKNFRAKLLSDQIIINPNIKEPLNSLQINSILHLGKALLDKGGLAKLQDCYPLQIFTIANSLKLFHTSNFGSFFYFLFFGLWNESVLNTKFKISVRQYFLETLLYICLFYYKYLQEHNLPDYVSFRKSSDHLYIFWVSEWKLIRMINSIISQIYAIALRNDKYALDRFGSHPTENFIGLIRLLCDNDNRFSVILHNLSRYEYVNRESPIIFTRPQNKRLNAGGCLLIEGEVDFETDQTSIQLAEILFNFIFLEESEENNIHLRNFIQNLEKLSREAIYKTMNVPNNTSGMQIMNRIITISRAQQELAQKQWQNHEIHQIDLFLLHGYHFISKETANQFNCTLEQLIQISEERKIELSKRAWTLQEDEIILQHLSDTLKNKDIANLLVCRTVNDVKKRKTFLRKEIGKRQKKA